MDKDERNSETRNSETLLLPDLSTAVVLSPRDGEWQRIVAQAAARGRRRAVLRAGAVASVVVVCLAVLAMAAGAWRQGGPHSGTPALVSSPAPSTPAPAPSTPAPAPSSASVAAGAVYQWPGSWATTPPPGTTASISKRRALALFRADASHDGQNGRLTPEVHLWLYSDPRAGLSSRLAWVLLLRHVAAPVIGPAQGPAPTASDCTETFVIDATSGATLSKEYGPC